jgi:hypothetical protein
MKNSRAMQNGLNPMCAEQHALWQALVVYAEELHDLAMAGELSAMKGQPVMRRDAGKRVRDLAAQLTHLVKALEVGKGGRR